MASEAKLACIQQRDNTKNLPHNTSLKSAMKGILFILNF
jgi:hypothetical protein